MPADFKINDLLNENFTEFSYSKDVKFSIPMNLVEILSGKKCFLRYYSLY